MPKKGKNSQKTSNATTKRKENADRKNGLEPPTQRQRTYDADDEEDDDEDEEEPEVFEPVSAQLAPIFDINWSKRLAAFSAEPQLRAAYTGMSQASLYRKGIIGPKQARLLQTTDVEKFQSFFIKKTADR
jgi:hypothetical protein